MFFGLLRMEFLFLFFQIDSMGIVHILRNSNIGKFGRRTTITNTNGDSNRIKLAYINSHKIGEIPKTGSRIVILRFFFNFKKPFASSKESNEQTVYQGKSCFSFFLSRRAVKLGKHQEFSFRVFHSSRAQL